MQRLEFVIGGVGLDRGNPARQAVRCYERVDHCTVVGTVAGSLDNDVSRESEEVAGGEEEIFACVTRRVLPFGRVREFIAGTEHVTMRVHRAWRWYIGRLRRARVERQPVGVHRKGLAHHSPRLARMASSRGYPRRALP